MSESNDIFYSLPEIWDFCLDKIYEKKVYVQGLVDLLGSRKITSQDLILDAGCGSGFPSIDLVEKGFRIIGTDKSTEMVRQVQLNAESRQVSMEAYNIMWQKLSRQFEPIFDFLYCRGNSLVYVASWEQNWIVPDRSEEEIQKALLNFYSVLKPGGQAYIDITNKNEIPHIDVIGKVDTRYGPVEISWKVDHAMDTRIRTWTISLHMLNSDNIRSYPSYGYLLPHSKLVEMLKTAGFKTVEEYVKVTGENNYDVFIATK